MTMRCTASSIPARRSRQHDQAYSDDPYGYQDGYGEAAEEPGQKRRGGMVTVAAVLALAVVGTGAAFAYRTYVGSPRSGEPPIIKADTSADQDRAGAADGNAKVPDRLAAGDGTEKIVPREEAPVDVNATGPAPRMVFPPLNQNANPPTAGERGAERRRHRPNAGNGTLPNNEPRKIKTFPVRGDQADGAAAPATAPPARGGQSRRRAARAQRPCHRRPSMPMPPAPMRRCRCRRRPPNRRPPPTPRTRVADQRRRCRPRPAAGGGGYLVQVSSQQNEADAQASYRVAAGQVPGGAGIAHAGDQARRSRRQGGLLPRHGRSVRLARRKRRSSAAA